MSVFPETNQDKSAASFSQQVAAWIPDMFCDFYIVDNHKLSYNPTTTNAREKKHIIIFEILKILELF
jgi:hypothetical protein